MSVTTRDNSVTTKIFIVTPLRNCLSILSLLCDNVTTKNEFFLRWERGRCSFNACSATPPVSEVGSVLPIHGFTLAPLGHHPRLSIGCLRRRRQEVSLAAAYLWRNISFYIFFNKPEKVALYRNFISIFAT